MAWVCGKRGQFCTKSYDFGIPWRERLALLSLPTTAFRGRSRVSILRAPPLQIPVFQFGLIVGDCQLGIIILGHTLAIFIVWNTYSKYGLWKIRGPRTGWCPLGQRMAFTIISAILSKWVFNDVCSEWEGKLDVTEICDHQLCRRTHYNGGSLYWVWMVIDVTFCKAVVHSGLCRPRHRCLLDGTCYVAVPMPIYLSQPVFQEVYEIQ